MWSNFYENGGWGMYPTTIFGFLLVASAVLVMLRPERRHALLAAGLGLLTLLAGALGMCTGLINTFRYVQGVGADEQFQIAAMGCAESLNNIVLALLIVVIATLMASIGAFRVVRAGRGAG